MKKLILILLAIFSLIGVNSAKGQNGTGNNSDFKVPVPAIAPQVTPNIAAPVITVPPPAPPMPGISPQITPNAAFVAANVVPNVPQAPPAPAQPIGGAAVRPAAVLTRLSLPAIISLPPIPAIPPSPSLRLRIGSN